MKTLDSKMNLTLGPHFHATSVISTIVHLYREVRTLVTPWPAFFFSGTGRLRPQVSFEILIDGNFDEKSLALAAILIATWRATAL
jgi:hypothetical protein